MRFVSSFALLSLAGLGLATPLHPREDVTGDQAAAAGAAYGTDALGGLTGGLGALGLRDEEHKDKHKGYGHGVHRRQDDGGSDSGEGHGVLLRGEHDEDHKEEHKGYPHGVHRRQDDGGSDSGEGHGVLLRTRGEYDEEEGSHEGDGEGEGEGEGEHKEKPKPKSKGKEKGKGKKGKGKGKGKDGKGKSHESKGKCNDARHTPCLHPDDVDVLINAYVRMLSKWNDTDAKYLADSFRDTSDSINILAGIPLGNPTFPTKQAFIDHQHTQPDNLPLTVTHKSPYSCDEIALIWKATFGETKKQVRGVTILGATKDKGYWQIKTIDVEFNSIAYLLDIGGSYTLPGQ